MNMVFLRGEILQTAVFSHASHGTSYYQMIISTERLSGTCDNIKVLLSETVLQAHDLVIGEKVEIEGTIRSFNNKSGEGNRLILSVLAKEIRGATDEASENKVTIMGTLCKAPIYRKTPLGREICDLMIAVPRHYGRADYLPVIAWGVCARSGSELGIGDIINIEGRFQSRVYTKIIQGEPVEKIAYEISAVSLGVGEQDSLTAGENT